MNTHIKKNIIDLDFQKNLIIASTSIALLFTYFVGIAIALFTKQIDFKDYIILTFLALLSILIISLGIYFIVSSVSKIKSIPKTLQNLEIN